MHDLRAMIEHASTMVDRLFAERGRIYRQYECFGQNGEHFVVAAPPVKNRDLATALMRAFFERWNVVAYVVIDEAWTLLSPDPWSMEMVAKLGVANHPDRVEIVLICAENHNGQLMARRQILREPGRKPTLGPLHVDDNVTQLEGRMVGMLPNKGTSH